jgi:hypothetical protein
MTTRRNRSKHLAKRARVARRKLAASASLHAGERLLPNYSHGAAECDCDGGTDRCIECGMTWPAKQYDDDDRRAA